MRSIIIATLALCVSATLAFGEEAYTLTRNAYGACVGTQMRFKYDPPERIAEVIKEKCGKLEAQEEEQFSDFLRDHIGQTLTAELAFTIMAHNIASLSKLREGAIDAYVKAMKQPPKPKPPLQLRK
jgi:hypothetical protein